MLTTDRPPTKPAEMTLQEAKQVTQAIKDNFDSLGAMLMQARDRKAYRALGYKSFEGYVNSEFGKSVSRAYQLIEDHKLVEQLSTAISERLKEKITIKIPSSHLKPLKALEDTDKQLEALEYAKHLATKEERKPTKADLEMAVYEISGKKPEDFKKAIEAKGYKPGVQVELISTKHRGIITKIDRQGKIYFRNNSSSSAGIPYDQTDLRILEASEYPRLSASENVKKGAKIRIFSPNYKGKEGIIFNNKPGKIATVQLQDGTLIYLPYAELECTDDIYYQDNYQDNCIDVTPKLEIIELERDAELHLLREKLATEVAKNFGLRQQIELLEKQNKELCDRLLAVEKPGKAVGISFGKTLEELLSGRKTQTRRSWQDNYAKNFIKYWEEGTEIPALDKQRQYGGKQVGKIKLTEKPYQQLLSEMPLSDLKKEGGTCTTVQEFIETFFEGKDQLVWVLNFEFDRPEIASVITDRDNLLIRVANLQCEVHKLREKEVAPLEKRLEEYETVLAETERDLRAAQAALMAGPSKREKILEEQLEEAKRAIEEMVAGLRGNDNHENNSADENPVEAAPDTIDSWISLLESFGFSQCEDLDCDDTDEEYGGWIIKREEGAIDLIHEQKGCFSRCTEFDFEIDDPIAWAKKVINQVENFCPGQLSLFLIPKPAIATFEETFSNETLERIENQKQRLLRDISQATESNKDKKRAKDRESTNKFIARTQKSLQSLDKFLQFRIGQKVYLTNKFEQCTGEITGVALSTGGMPNIFVRWPGNNSSTPEMVDLLELVED